MFFLKMLVNLYEFFLKKRSEVSCIAKTTTCFLVIFNFFLYCLCARPSYDKFKLWTSCINCHLYFLGDHKVNVYYAGTLVKGCPYTVRVWDASRVIVSNMPTSSVYGQPVVFDSKLKVLLNLQYYFKLKNILL